MRLLALLALLLFSTAPARAQTCVGQLTVSFRDPAGSTARDQADSLAAAGTFVERFEEWADMSDPPDLRALPFDSVLALTRPGPGRRFAVEQPGYARLHAEGRDVSFHTRCGYALVRLVLTRSGTTMTLDLYHVPTHGRFRFSRPLMFAPGRFRADLRGFRSRVEYAPNGEPVHLLPSEWVVPAGEE